MQTITRDHFIALAAFPQTMDREQMLPHRHITELSIGNRLVAIRTLTASTAVYRGPDAINSEIADELQSCETPESLRAVLDAHGLVPLMTVANAPKGTCFTHFSCGKAVRINPLALGGNHAH